MDSTGNLLGVVGPDGATANFSYDGQGRLAKIRDPAGRVLRVKYRGDSDEPSEISGPGSNGPVRRFDYDAAGHLTGIRIDGESVASFAFDGQGRPIERKVRGRTIRFSYDEAGRLASETDGLGRVWTYGYDVEGHLARVINPDGGIESATFGAGGKVAAIDDATGVRETLGTAPSQATSALPLLSTDRFTVDSLGRVVGRETAAGERTAWQYDDQSRLVGMTLPDGGKLRWSYDKFGRPVKATNGSGRGVSYSYDANDRLVGVASPSGDRASHTYDAAGRLIASVRPNGSRVALTYDLNDNLVETKLPGGGVRRASYDQASRLTALQSADGHKVTYGHDQAGRLAARAEGTRSSHFIYDGARLAAVEDSAWPIAFNYDSRGFVAATSFARAGNAALQFEADANGRRSAVVTPAGRIGYSYDARGNLVRLQTPAGEIALGYDAAGRIATAKLPNGVEGAWTFRADGKLASLQWSDAHGKALAAWSLTYDALGLPKAMASKEFANRQFGYDDEGRLTSERRGDALTQYAYGPGGDRTRVSGAGPAVAYRYDPAGRLTDAGGALALDTDDRVVSRTGSTGTWGYGWDAENHLVAATGPAQLQFTYDVFGNPVQRVSGADIRQYLFDEGEPVAAVDGGGKPLALNVFAPGCAAPILTIEAGQAHFLACDPFGATALVADQSGGVIGKAEIDAFGVPLALPDRPFDLFLLHGMAFDRDLKLYRAGARRYDPAIGRFLTPDPLVGKLSDPQAQNSYAFARYAPTAFADPTGAEPSDWRIQLQEDAAKLDLSKAQLRDLLARVDSALQQPNAPGGPLSPQQAAAAASQAMGDAVNAAVTQGVKGPDALASVNASLSASGKLPGMTVVPSQSVIAPQASAPAPALGRANLPNLSVTPGEGVVVLDTPPVSPSVALPGSATPPPFAPSGAAAASSAPIDVLSPAASGVSNSVSAPRPVLPSAGAVAPRVPTAAVAPALDVPAQGSGAAASAGPKGGTVAVGANAGSGSGTQAIRTFGPWKVTMPSLKDSAKTGGAVAVVSGLTDMNNCIALGGSAKDCATALGVGTAKGVAWGGVGAVLGSVAVAIAEGVAGVAAGTAVAVGLTTYGGYKIGKAYGNSLANMANSGLYGTPQHQATSHATLASLDPRIAELNEIGRTIRERLEKPYADAQKLLASLRGMTVNQSNASAETNGETPSPQSSRDAAQSLGMACAAATKSMSELTDAAQDADRLAADALKALTKTDRLDMSVGAAATRDAATKASEAIEKVSGGIQAASFAGKAL